MAGVSLGWLVINKKKSMSKVFKKTVTPSCVTSCFRNGSTSKPTGILGYFLKILLKLLR